MKKANPNHPSRLKIIEFLSSNPEATITEICAAVGLGRTAVRHHIFNLDRDGLIHRCNDDGQLIRMKRHQKTSSEKLTEYAKLGRGKNAFVPRKKKHDKLQERIDMVVAKALGSENNTQHDVISHVNARLRLSHSTKIG